MRIWIGFFQLFLINHYVNPFVSKAACRYVATQIESITNTSNKISKFGELRGQGFYLSLVSCAVYGQFVLVFLDPFFLDDRFGSDLDGHPD